MTIHAQVEADSMSPHGVRLTTFVLTYPRFIHAEFMTHRAFSRNASSSRAIPVRRQIALIRRDMAVPVHIGASQPGMQAANEVSPGRRRLALGLWRGLGWAATAVAEVMARQGIHKQVVNRVLEPWSHITVICTATDYANFFALRHHAMAQPELFMLAARMRQAMDESKPVARSFGDWHLPFVTAQERLDMEQALLVKLSAARCARVSYLTHEGRRPDQARDLALHARLLEERPLHASPGEHQALADPKLAAGAYSGNLRGWRQYRKLLDHECEPEAKPLTIVPKRRARARRAPGDGGGLAV